MWVVLIALLVLAGVVHAYLRYRGVPGRWAELALVYVLAVACGVVQVILAIALLRAPEHMAAHLALPGPNGMEIWTAALLMGGGLVSTLTIWLRGTYLIAPVVLWATFFFGATYAHLRALEAAGHHQDLHDVVHIFVSHGLVSLLLIALGLFARRSRL